MQNREIEQKESVKIIAISSVMSVIGSGALLMVAQLFS